MKKKIIYGILVFIFGIFSGGLISFVSSFDIVNLGSLSTSNPGTSVQSFTQVSYNGQYYFYYIHGSHSFLESGTLMCPFGASAYSSTMQNLDSMVYLCSGSSSVDSSNLLYYLDGTISNCVLMNTGNTSDVQYSDGLKCALGYSSVDTVSQSFVFIVGPVGDQISSSSRRLTPKYYQLNNIDSLFPFVKSYKNYLTDLECSSEYSGYILPSQCPSCPTNSGSDITVFYNNGSSTTIDCDGVQAISIEGPSSLSATNTFSPKYSIFYNGGSIQSLTTSDILLNGLYVWELSGNNNSFTPVVNCEDESNSQFSGYLPTFEITGGIEDVTESGNIFNNFAENSVKVALSNIPSYIQYVIIIMLLFFVLGLAKRKKRR